VKFSGTKLHITLPHELKIIIHIRGSIIHIIHIRFPYRPLAAKITSIMKISSPPQKKAAGGPNIN
jgi:hypothetical protein